MNISWSQVSREKQLGGVWVKTSVERNDERTEQKTRGATISERE